MMLIDLQVHTQATQPWGSVAGGTLTHKEAIARAKAAGLDAICFTERFRPSGIEEALKAGREENFPVFIGADVPALRGRLLFIPADYHHPEIATILAERTVPLTAEELSNQLAPLGAVFVVTPYSREVGRAPMCDRAFMIPNLHGVVAFTGYSLNDETAEELAAELAMARGIAVVGGSDVTDDPGFIGKAATLLRGDPKTQAELCALLKSGDAWSIQLGRQPSPVSEDRYDRPREPRGDDRRDRGDRDRGDRGDRRGPPRR